MFKPLVSSTLSTKAVYVEGFDFQSGQVYLQASIKSFQDVIGGRRDEVSDDVQIEGVDTINFSLDNIGGTYSWSF